LECGVVSRFPPPGWDLLTLPPSHIKLSNDCAPQTRPGLPHVDVLRRNDKCHCTEERKFLMNSKNYHNNTEGLAINAVVAPAHCWLCSVPDPVALFEGVCIHPSLYKPPPNKGPLWTIGGTFFWVLGGGLLFGQWSTLFLPFSLQFP